jgi:hypothetical protein
VAHSRPAHAQGCFAPLLPQTVIWLKRPSGGVAMTGNCKTLLVAAVGVAIADLLSAAALAHCDGMDGPVVEAAQAALKKSDVNLVLIWVRKNDEAEIRGAFERTLNVR